MLKKIRSYLIKEITINIEDGTNSIVTRQINVKKICFVAQPRQKTLYLSKAKQRRETKLYIEVSI